MHYTSSIRAGRSGDRIPVGGGLFRQRPDRPWGSPSLLYNVYRVFPGGKAAFVVYSRVNFNFTFTVPLSILLLIRSLMFPIKLLAATCAAAQHSNKSQHLVQHSTVQYSRVQYSAVQYSTVQYSTVQYSTVQYSTVQYNAVQHSTVPYSAVQHSTVQYSTVQYSTVQYSTVE